MAGCVMREPLPPKAPLGPHVGLAPSDFDRSTACEAWRWATASEAAKQHDAFPELSSRGCFATVHYERSPERIVAAGEPDSGCDYVPAEHAAELRERAATYRAIAEGRRAAGASMPLELACELPDDVRTHAARTNAATLEDLATDARSYAYAAGITFGYGHSEQDEAGLVGWRPADRCVSLDDTRRSLLSVNVTRADRASETWRSGLAPVVIVSGGAVHAQTIEAFMLMHLAVCDGGVPAARVLVDPCADHTHTNVRNAGALVRYLGARTAYVVTDDFLQGDYLQEWAGFELIGGSIDDRSLRDFGHLLGSWRQASRGIDSGFWFTPYRFFSDPDPENRWFTCVGDVPDPSPPPVEVED
jgi:hypothetical protein